MVSQPSCVVHSTDIFRESGRVFPRTPPRQAGLLVPCDPVQAVPLRSGSIGTTLAVHIRSSGGWLVPMAGDVSCAHLVLLVESCALTSPRGHGNTQTELETIPSLFCKCREAVELCPHEPPCPSRDFLILLARWKEANRAQIWLRPSPNPEEVRTGDQVRMGGLPSWRLPGEGDL